MAPVLSLSRPSAALWLVEALRLRSERAIPLTAKYGEDFETWRQTVLDSEPPFEAEQDYFDWEMAVTGIADMQEEIEQLRRLKHQA